MVNGLGQPQRRSLDIARTNVAMRVDGERVIVWPFPRRFSLHVRAGVTDLPYM
jgi:hypothetical protein